MSKKFRSLVGAILSTSVCSCCVSSGLLKNEKIGLGTAVIGSAAVGAGMYFWSANKTQENEMMLDKAYTVSCLGGKDNYSVLKEFYELEKENLGDECKIVGSKLANMGLITSLSVRIEGVKGYEKVEDKDIESLLCDDVTLKGDKIEKFVSEVNKDLRNMFRAIFVDFIVRSIKSKPNSSDTFHIMCFSECPYFSFKFSDSCVTIDGHNGGDEHGFKLTLKRPAVK